MKCKKSLSILICISIILAALSVAFYSFANEIQWNYDDKTKTIFIFGNGKMQDFENEYAPDWASYMNVVENVVIEDGVTSVGAYAFSGAKRLSSVTVADSVTSIGTNAFSACPMLLSLTLSESISSIADSSFAYIGTAVKDGFKLNVNPASYALNFAIDNRIDFLCDNVKCGMYDGKIYPAGMTAYYPYTPKVNGVFKFYSNSKLDTLGAIYDSEFNELNSNDDYDDSDFYFEQKLQKDKTYYIALSLFSSYIAGAYQLVIEPVSYTVNAGIYAMKSPKGEPSNILLSGALVDGIETDGTISMEITQLSKEITVEYNYVSKKFILSPDEEATLSLMVCDLNNDGIVNGIDYVMMKKTSSPFLPLFSDFAHYRY